MQRPALFVTVTLGALLTFGCASHAPSTSSVRLLHTNDTHAYLAGGDERFRPCLEPQTCYGGHGRLAHAIRAIKEKDSRAYAVDAGDLWQGSLFFSVGKDRLASDIQAAMPWDAAIVGNHEFDLGCAPLRGYLDATPRPLLITNLSPARQCPLHGARYDRLRIVTINGTKVGFFGLINDQVRHISSACEHTHFIERHAAAKAAVAELTAQGVRRIVAVTHIGYENDVALARAVPGIDVIIGGHSHTFLASGHDKSAGSYPTVVESRDGDKTLIVTAFTAARLLGDLTVTFDASGRVTDWKGTVHDLRPSHPTDPRLDDVLAAYRPLVRERAAERLAHNPNDPAKEPEQCRQALCTGGAVLTDAYVDFGRRYGASMAFVNAGAVRHRLTSGTVTRADVMKSYPYDNRPVVVQADGTIIRALLENGAATTSPRLVQPSGLRYRVDLSRPKGERVVDIEVSDAKGVWTRFNEKGTYRFVVSTYMARAQSKHAPLAGLEPLAVGPTNDAELAAEYLKRIGRVPLTDYDRIVLIGKKK